MRAGPTPLDPAAHVRKGFGINTGKIESLPKEGEVELSILF
jgi:hypothetical protein